MSKSRIARRYARALVELCTETKNLNVIGKQVETFSRMWASSMELQSVLGSPIVPLDQKHEVLNAVFAKVLFAPITRNFLLALLDHKRIGVIEEIAAAFATEVDVLNNRVRATVTSAQPMQRQDLVRIQAALQRLTNKTVNIEAKVDPTLIGGVVTQIGNTVLDGSVRTQLDQVREALLD